MDGDVEAASSAGRMREMPWAGVVMILNFGTAARRASG